MQADESQPHGDLEQRLTVHAAQANWAMGQIGPCLIVIWRGIVTSAALHLVNDHIMRLTQERPGRCAYVNVIEKNSPHPAAPERKLAMEGAAKPGKALTCMAAAIEGHELRSTVVRAILTGMAFLLPQSQPTRFFKNTTDLSVWVKKQLPDPSLDELVPAIEILRGKMPAA